MPSENLSPQQEVGEPLIGHNVAAVDAERLRQAQEAGRSYLFEIGLDGAAHCDDGLRALYGVAPGARLDLDAWLPSLHPDDRDEMLADFTRMVQQGGETRVEYRVIQPNGSVRWLLTQARSAEGGEAPGSIFGVTTDITERRATRDLLLERQRASEESEAQIRAILESTVDGVFVLSADWRFTFLNARAVALISGGRDLLGQMVWEVFPEAVGGPLWQAYQRCMVERVTAEAEQFLPRLDRVFAARATPAHDGGIIVFFSDITRQREAEAVLARSKADLEQLVEARTRDLRDAQVSLVHAQRMEALGQLAGGVAHDFNNILQATQGGAALLAAKAENPETVRHIAQMITEAAGRGRAVTQRLLAFSRRGEPQVQSLDPAALLSSMREILVHTLGSGVDILVEAAGTMPPLRADKGQLETVLVNLATNARDAMADGTGTLTLTASIDSCRQDRRAGYPAELEPGDYVRLTVTDTGCGMDADTLAQAAEPFFTTKEPGRGTGLGLAMARGFANQSGGALGITSAIGLGTAVTLWFPAARGEAEAPALPERPLLPRVQQPAHVLLVDDDELVREVLAQHLQDEGYLVAEAPDGAAALALLDEGQPVDILVTDLTMPRMDGVALIHEVRLRRPGLPAFLLTGFSGETNELEARGAADGGFEMLQKPITGGYLAERIAELLAASPCLIWSP